MAIVAVMLMPQPSPASARSRNGSQPASVTKWKNGTETMRMNKPEEGDAAAAADVDHPAEEGPDGDGHDAVDAHDQADPALARAEPFEDDGIEEEERDRHEQEEVAGEAQQEIPVPERRAAMIGHGSVSIAIKAGCFILANDKLYGGL